MCGRLDYYLETFAHLPFTGQGTASTTQGKPAPFYWSSLLLLAVLDQIESSELLRNYIIPSPELERRYRSYQLQISDRSLVQPSLALPFWHLRTSQFWHLRPRGSTKTLPEAHPTDLAELKRLVYGATLNDDLYSQLQMRTFRTKLRNCLITSCSPANICY